MKVEILEDRLSTRDRETDRLYVQEKGDIITVPEKLGKRWCSLGWAKDVDGNVETGERKPGVHKLEIQSTKHGGTKRGGKNG